MTSSVPLPPPYNRIHRHEVLPEVTHDESSRLNFISNLNTHIGAALFPGVGAAYEGRVEVRDAMKKDSAYQVWAAIRRNTMEMRHQIGRAVVFRQIDRLIDNAKRLNDGSNRLRLDDSVVVPRYVAAADNHCMPGSYYSELFPDDVSGPANYETGHYATVAGGTGPKSDIVGRGMVAWLKAHHPDLTPARIVDFGAGAGINTLPIAEAYPEADVWAVDVAAPMLRYGHARAKTMGIENVIFQQADVEQLDIEPGSVDIVISAMFFHETSTKALRAILTKAHTLLKPGGLMLHMEQPNFDPDTTPFEKFVRDWDCWYNAEPFWAKLHTLDVVEEMVAAGFDRADIFETAQPINRNHDSYPAWAGAFSRHAHEAKMRDTPEAPNPKKAGGIYMFGAFKQK
jgi:ubiquinone/menaquinone biosynthesis C-methylase UbiE